MNYFSLLLELFILKRNEKKTQSEIKAIRERKLRKLLLYAYDNSEYYRNSFEKAGIDKNLVKTLPLNKFPATDKNILIENFDMLVTANDLTQEELRNFDLDSTSDELFKGKYHIVHSSGSSEKPGYFVYDKQAWRSMLIGMVRGALWEKSIFGIIKYMLKKPKIVYIAATDGRYGGAMAVGAGINGIGAKQLFLDIKTPLDEWIKQLNEFKPNTVIGYPSAIKILTELAKNKELSLNLNRIVSCGEPLNGTLRKTLEDLFHTDVINFYGASESIALGVEGMTENGMYLFDDVNYIEFIDGEMYLTCLYNYVQPIIRYKLSDKLTVLPYDKNNRYPFTKVKSIVGRNEDLMWFENVKGNREFIHPLAIEGFCIDGMRDYQFRQIDVSAFEMLIESSDKSKCDMIRNKMFCEMRDILREKELTNVQFYVKFVDEIAPEKYSGKKKLVIKNFKEEVTI